MQEEIRILLAGGGTGGHIFPAIRIAQHLKEQWGARCRFIGTKNGLENIKVPQAGFVLKNIWISGLHRRLDLRNLLFPLKVMISLMQSKREIHEFQPDLVIGTGGYVSGPVLYQASRMGIPTAIQEQNSFPGITTRLLSARVDLVLLAYEEALKYLKKVQAYKIVGNPVSVSGGKVNRKDACRAFDLNPVNPVILVFGGSQGARNINRAMDSLLSGDLLGRTQVIWQTGKSNFDQYRAKYDRGGDSGLRLYPFIDRMDLAYGASDLAICRAGAMTLAEIAAAGLPAILVPLASAAGNHQSKNAQTISAGGGALIVEEDDHTVRNLGAAIKTILGSPDKRKDMSEKIRRFYNPDCLDVMTEEFAGLIRSADSGEPG